ncbi:cysteine synthase family protein [Candidatus Bipolaricaulota bacterium]|nr:cysteine synthase family protein [Candidatus Bipolaricaulota bacterium]TFH07632.1 MAG: cysteine synthase family protein [Candidatus Atribacteria bacterium]
MSVLESIGNTPLVELQHLDAEYPHIKIRAKLEGSNPGGSVKDRPALFMIREAIREGKLTPDKIILEPTSGNTGIALAMIGAAMGYRVTLCMPECVSSERRHTLEAYGAEIILTPGSQNTDGAIRIARDMMAAHPDRYFMPDQFANPHNPQSHYETTGPEILKQNSGHIDAFVAGMGTGGTLMGMSRFLREHSPGTRVIGIEPTGGHTIQGLKNMSESMVPEIYDASMLDEKLTVTDADAYGTARRLATEEGLLVGMSSGAAVAGALQYAATIKQGTIVVLLPDRGDRYLSTTLFRSICAECPP